MLFCTTYHHHCDPGDLIRHYRAAQNATIKALDIIVPVMAAMYFIITIFIIVTHIGQLPGVFSRIFKEAFGLRAVAGGGFGAVLMNGVKRGLFSNEAGSGSAPARQLLLMKRNRLKWD